MFFTMYFLQNITRFFATIQALTTSLWGWMVLFLAFILALDAVLALMFLAVSNYWQTTQPERWVEKRASAQKRLSLKTINQQEDSDLRAALEKLQDDHVAAVLREIPLREACIPGVWPLVKERLAAQGIATAYEACIDRLLPLRWLGEVPLRGLLAWRAGLEASARRTMPRRLPAEVAAQIHARYEVLRRAVVEENGTRSSSAPTPG